MSESPLSPTQEAFPHPELIERAVGTGCARGVLVWGWQRPGIAVPAFTPEVASDLLCAFSIFITTDEGQSLEQALRAAGCDPLVISGDARADPIQESRVIVVHLYGKSAPPLPDRHTSPCIPSRLLRQQHALWEQLRKWFWQRPVVLAHWDPYDTGLQALYEDVIRSTSSVERPPPFALLPGSKTPDVINRWRGKMDWQLPDLPGAETSDQITAWLRSLAAAARSFPSAPGEPDGSRSPSDGAGSARAGLRSANPFRGVLPFDKNDRDVFYGRGQVIAELVERLRAERLLLLCGPSGVGKTSLIQAGIMPALSSRDRPVYIRAGSQPADAICRVLCDELQIDRATALTELADRARRDDRRFVVFVDQFEELLIGADSHARFEAARALGELCDALGPAMHLVAAIRQDFCAQLYEIQPPLPILLSHVFKLNNLPKTDAQEAMERPAAAHGSMFEAGLVDAVLADLADKDGQIQPPQLQIVCQQLWEDLGAQTGAASTLTWERYNALGRAKRMLAEHLDRSVAAISSPPETTKEVLKALVTATETRACLTLPQIARRAGLEDLQAVDAIVRELTAHRLIIPSEPVLGQGTYELCHDYFAQKIGADWMGAEEKRRRRIQDILHEESDSEVPLGLDALREVANDVASSHLNLSVDEVELLLRSAVWHDAELTPWLERLKPEQALATLQAMASSASIVTARVKGVRAIGQLDQTVTNQPLNRHVAERRDQIRARNRFDHEVTDFLLRKTSPSDSPDMRVAALEVLTWRCPNSRMVHHRLATLRADGEPAVRDRADELLQQVAPTRFHILRDLRTVGPLLLSTVVSALCVLSTQIIAATNPIQPLAFWLTVGLLAGLVWIIYVGVERRLFDGINLLTDSLLLVIAGLLLLPGLRLGFNGLMGLTAVAEPSLRWALLLVGLVTGGIAVVVGLRLRRNGWFSREVLSREILSDIVRRIIWVPWWVLRRGRKRIRQVLPPAILLLVVQYAFFPGSRDYVEDALGKAVAVAQGWFSIPLMEQAGAPFPFAPVGIDFRLAAVIILGLPAFHLLAQLIIVLMRRLETFLDDLLIVLAGLLVGKAGWMVWQARDTIAAWLTASNTANSSTRPSQSRWDLFLILILALFCIYVIFFDLKIQRRAAGVLRVYRQNRPITRVKVRMAIAYLLRQGSKGFSKLLAAPRPDLWKFLRDSLTVCAPASLVVLVALYLLLPEVRPDIDLVLMEASGALDTGRLQLQVSFENIIILLRSQPAALRLLESILVAVVLLSYRRLDRQLPWRWVRYGWLVLELALLVVLLSIVAQLIGGFPQEMLLPQQVLRIALPVFLIGSFLFVVPFLGRSSNLQGAFSWALLMCGVLLLYWYVLLPACRTSIREPLAPFLVAFDWGSGVVQSGWASALEGARSLTQWLQVSGVAAQSIEMLRPVAFLAVVLFTPWGLVFHLFGRGLGLAALMATLFAGFVMFASVLLTPRADLSAISPGTQSTLVMTIGLAVCCFFVAILVTIRSPQTALLGALLAILTCVGMAALLLSDKGQELAALQPWRDALSMQVLPRLEPAWRSLLSAIGKVTPSAEALRAPVFWLAAMTVIWLAPVARGLPRLLLNLPTNRRFTMLLLGLFPAILAHAFGASPSIVALCAAASIIALCLIALFRPSWGGLWGQRRVALRILSGGLGCAVAIGLVTSVRPALLGAQERLLALAALAYGVILATLAVAGLEALSEIWTLCREQVDLLWRQRSRKPRRFSRMLLSVAAYLGICILGFIYLAKHLVGADSALQSFLAIARQMPDGISALIIRATEVAHASRWGDLEQLTCIVGLVAGIGWIDLARRGLADPRLLWQRSLAVGRWVKDNGIPAIWVRGQQARRATLRLVGHLKHGWRPEADAQEDEIPTWPVLSESVAPFDSELSWPEEIFPEESAGASDTAPETGAGIANAESGDDVFFRV